MKTTALVVAVVWCAAMAALGGVLAGRGGVEWFRSLRRPRMRIPMPAWCVVAALVYLMDGVIIYRLISFDMPREGRIVCLTAMGAAMVFAEFWNYLFFGLRSPLAAFAGLTAYVPTLFILQTALFLFEPVAAWVLLPYVVYTLAYSMPWALRLSKLNG